MQLQRLSAISRALVADGSNGFVRIAAPNVFVVGQSVSLSATGLSATGLQVLNIKGVLGSTDCFVYLVDGTGTAFNASAYTVVGSAVISADAQTLWYGLGVDGAVPNVFTDAQLATILSAVLPGGANNPSPVQIENVPSTVMTLLSGIDVGVSVVSSAVDVSAYKNFTIEAIAALDSVITTGTLKVEFSNDPVNPVNWVDNATTAALTVVPGFKSALSGTIAASFKWARLVWLNTTSTVRKIVPVPDVGGNLAGKYLLMNGAMSATFPFGVTTTTTVGDFYAFWFKVSGVGVSPGVVTLDGHNYSPVEVDIATNDNATTIATNLATAMNNVRLGVFYSTDAGASWKPAALPFNASGPPGIAFGNNLFVMVGNGRAWQSTNGVDWTTNTAGTPNITINACAYGAGLFVAVGAGGGIWSSPDGITWTSRTSGVAFALNCIAFNGTNFIALGAGTTTGVLSTNGTGWSTITVVSGTYGCIAWNGNAYCAVTTASNVAMTSATGASGSWTSRTFSSGSGALGIAAIPGGIFAATNGTPSVNFDYSLDNGATWSFITGSISSSSSSSTNQNIAWDPVGNVFVIPGISINTSPDGLVWQIRSITSLVNTASTGPTKVMAGNGVIVTVSTAAGTANFVAAGVGANLAVAAPGGVIIPSNYGNAGFTVTRIQPVLSQTITGLLNAI